MKRVRTGSLALFVLFGAASPGSGQDAAMHQHSEHSLGSDVRDELLGHFESSSEKIAQLARAMPEELYTWAPGEGLMTVAEVYTHLARYNFMYLDENLGIAPPDGLDYADLETITDKQTIREIFDLSVEHVQGRVAGLTESALSGQTRLYGREVAGWAVLVQLVAHMNEHVGQAVAYARMNEITPPWAR